MTSFDDLLSLPIFSNSPVAWLAAVAVAAGVFILLFGARRAVRSYHRRFEKAGVGALVQIPLRVLSRTTLLFFVVLALFAGCAGNANDSAHEKRSELNAIAVMRSAGREIAGPCAVNQNAQAKKLALAKSRSRKPNFQ